MLKVLLVSLYFSKSFAASYPNNVCKEFGDYATIEMNKNCYYNPDVDSSLSEIAARYGFPFESYNITTQDGYILGLFRIPHDNISSTFRRQPVVLQHGLFSSAATWMLLGEKSLAFVLARNGYDVWLANFRGNSYSNSHTNPRITDKQYWDFSFHEVGYYDLPAYIDFISNATGGNKNDLIYIGHSMGTTVSFVYSSLRKQEAEQRLEKIIAIAPIAYMKNLKGIAPVLLQLFHYVKETLDNAGIYAIGQYIELQRQVAKRTCNVSPLICDMIQSFATGLVTNQLKAEIFPMVSQYLPQGTATKTIDHYAQIYLKRGRFQMFDLGARANRQFYNSSDPPVYPVAKISIPVHLVLGTEDFLGNKEDVDVLYNRLTCQKSLHGIEMSHNDFLFGGHVEKFYETLLKIMRENK